MLKFNERPSNQVQNPESPDKVLFLNPDGVLQLKDSAGTLTSIVAESSTGQSTARPFKVYKAKLTQSSTDAPVATIVENTLGGTPVYAFSSTGVFTATLTGAFPLAKTLIVLNSNVVAAVRTSDNVITLTGASNGLLTDTTLIIEVYP